MAIKTTDVTLDTGKIIKWAGISIAAVIIILLLWLLIQYLLNKIKETGTTSKQNDQINKEVQNSGVQPSYTDPEYVIFANKLKTALEGYWIWGSGGQDFPTIRSVINQMYSKVDMMKLSQKFGTYKNTGWDLNYIILRRLDSNEVKELNNILANKGIDYMFQ